MIQAPEQGEGTKGIMSKHFLAFPSFLLDHTSVDDPRDLSLNPTKIPNIC